MRAGSQESHAVRHVMFSNCPDWCQGILDMRISFQEFQKAQQTNNCSHARLWRHQALLSDSHKTAWGVPLLLTKRSCAAAHCLGRSRTDAARLVSQNAGAVLLLNCVLPVSRSAHSVAAWTPLILTTGIQDLLAAFCCTAGNPPSSRTPCPWQPTITDLNWCLIQSGAT